MLYLQDTKIKSGSSFFVTFFWCIAAKSWQDSCWGNWLKFEAGLSTPEWFFGTHTHTSRQVYNSHSGGDRGIPGWLHSKHTRTLPYVDRVSSLSGVGNLATVLATAFRVNRTPDHPYRGIKRYPNSESHTWPRRLFCGIKASSTADFTSGPISRVAWSQYKCAALQSCEVRAISPRVPHFFLVVKWPKLLKVTSKSIPSFSRCTLCQMWLCGNCPLAATPTYLTLWLQPVLDWVPSP